MALPHGIRRPGAALTLACAWVALSTPVATAAERLPDGAVIAGVQVGGQGPIGAERALRGALAQTHERAISIRVRGRDSALSPAQAGYAIDYDAMVERAFDLNRRGRLVDVPLRRSIAGERLTAAVSQVGRRYARAPRNARVRFGVTRVVRIRHRFGRALDTGQLRRAVLAELREPSPNRVVKASLGPVRPAVTLRQLPARYGTFISIDRRTFTLRLFKRLRVVRSYGVAVGAGGYDTPAGLHAIVSKQVNPAWHAPNRPWAGQYAGQTIPAGDPRNPLKARFLAIGGGVGIHGTADEGSIGSRASHGCIRMRVREVKLLYARVPVGTPVLIN